MAPTATPTRARSDLVVGITTAELDHDPDREPLADVWYSSADGTQAHRRAAGTTPPLPALSLARAGSQLTRCSPDGGQARVVSTFPARHTVPRCLGCR